MELQDYLAVLRKRWVTILAVAVATVFATIGLTLITTPSYEARAQVFVSVRNGGTTSDLLQGSNFTARQVKSYTQLVTSPRVLIPVIENLDLSKSPDELAKQVRADSPLDSVLINITASDPDPRMASDIANSTANSLAEQVTELEKPDNGPSPVQISTVRVASAPDSPASPSLLRNLVLGLVLGLVTGFGLALLRELLDTRVRNVEDVTQVTDTSVIAQVAYEEDAQDHPLIVHSKPQSRRAESFRRLRTNLQFLDFAERPQSIVITSSLPGEGKSTTSINLAITLADAGSRVCLVDADLRRPSVAEYMGLEGGAGLTTVLIGRAALKDVIHPWGNGYLHVLTSGQVPPNPSELLGSRSMAQLLDQLTQEYDIVLLDTAPLLPVTDAAILSRLTGGALLVVGADKIDRHHLAESVNALQTVGARMLGIVVNRLSRKGGEAYTYYDYSSTTGERQPTSKRDARKATARGQRAVEAPPRVPVRRTSRMDDGQHQASLETLVTDQTDSAPRQNRWPGGPLH